MALASFFSLSMSSSTSATLTPAALTGGSSTDMIFVRGVRSIPNEVASSFSSGFFFAFIRFGSVAYLGSFRRRSVVTTAGRLSFIVCIPESTSRSTVSPSLASLAVRADVKVDCGHPRRPASICPIWFESLSMDCFPHSTMLGSSFSTTFCRSLATASGCSSWSVRMSVVISTALSAPIARLCRNTSCDFSCPIETAISSEINPFSFIRIPSSTAISQKGFMLIFTFLMSTPDLSFDTRTFTA
mmetsp:Transcript_21546/g.54326  ORF Transcript_21546/g.54326 Transcript_21546/m.54326 type:complete len:243 (+) Transcript_21546:215-943(+)